MSLRDIFSTKEEITGEPDENLGWWGRTARRLKGEKLDPKVTTKERWLTVGKLLLLTVWVFIVVEGMGSLIGFIMVRILGDQMLNAVWQTVYSALFYVLAFVMILFVTPKLVDLWHLWHRETKGKLKKCKIASREQLGLTGLPTWTDIGLAPVGLILSLLLSSALTGIFSVFPWFNAEQEQDVLFSPFVVGFDRIMAFVMLVVVAPIVEELIFRGWLYGKMRESMHGKFRPWLAIGLPMLLVSLLFGVVHGQWNVGIVVFAMSLVMCALREITGTIYAGMLVHILKNAVAFMMLFSWL